MQVIEITLIHEEKYQMNYKINLIVIYQLSRIYLGVDRSMHRSKPIHTTA